METTWSETFFQKDKQQTVDDALDDSLCSAYRVIYYTRAGFFFFLDIHLPAFFGTSLFFSLL